MTDIGAVKFGYSRFNSGRIVRTFGRKQQLRPKVDNDVISGMAVANVGMDVAVKVDDSKSNGFRDIRGADFVSNERTMATPILIAIAKKMF